MKQLPRIFRILLASLSIFNLIVYLYNYDLSTIVSSILTTYDEKILKPVRFFFKPVAEFLADVLEFTLPEWYPHIIVIWLFFGTVTVSALKRIDDKSGQTQKEFYLLGLIGDFFLCLLGVFLFVNVVKDWIKFELIAEPLDRKQTNYVAGIKVIAMEFIFAFTGVLIYFLINAFT